MAQSRRKVYGAGARKVQTRGELSKAERAFRQYRKDQHDQFLVDEKAAREEADESATGNFWGSMISNYVFPGIAMALMPGSAPLIQMILAGTAGGGLGGLLTGSDPWQEMFGKGDHGMGKLADELSMSKLREMGVDISGSSAGYIQKGVLDPASEKHAQYKTEYSKLDDMVNSWLTGTEALQGGLKGGALAGLTAGLLKPGSFGEGTGWLNKALGKSGLGETIGGIPGMWEEAIPTSLDWLNTISKGYVK